MYTNIKQNFQESNNTQSKFIDVNEIGESALRKDVFHELQNNCCDNLLNKAHSEINDKQANTNSLSKSKMKPKKKKILKSAKNNFQCKNNKNEIKTLHNNLSDLSDNTLKEKVKNSNNVLVTCLLCKTEFETIEASVIHKCDAMLSGFKMFTCNFCSLSFNQKNHLDMHMKGHTRNNCTICEEQFTKRKALGKHLKAIHNIILPEKLYHCSFCNKHFSKRPSLNAHLKLHANGQYFCIKCGFMCNAENVYNEHVEEHIKTSKYECKLCNKNFSRRQQYDQHMMGHERHSCSPCNITFSTKKLFLRHQQKVHGVNCLQKKHACPVCKKMFLRPKHLQMHQRIHTGERPVKCSHCEKSFCNERTLSKHMKSVRHLQRVGVDEIEKPFLCSECGARFYQQQSLFRHIEVIHHGTKSFKCVQCEYSTKSKANLKRHVELHTGVKRFICEICGSSFRALATLKEHHTYVHSENRSFVCDICKKGFKSKSSLQRHMRIHSEARPYKCHCNRAYKRMSHLKRHMMSAHNKTFKKNQIPIISKSTNLNNQNNSFALNDTFESLTDQSSSNDLTLMAVSSNISQELNDSMSKVVGEQLPTTTVEDINLIVGNCNDNPNAINNPVVNQDIDDQLPLKQSSNAEEKYSDVPSNIVQTPQNGKVTPEPSPQSTLISIIPSPMKYLHQNSLEDPSFSLSPPNFYSFIDNVTSTLQQSNTSQDVLSFSSTSDTLMRPHSLPNFQNSTSSLDTFPNFSINNSDSPTSLQLSSFLPYGDISPPPHIDLNLGNNVSKQLFGDSDDILSLPSYASNNELNNSNCTSENLFSSTRDLELWEASDNRLKMSDSDTPSSSANTNFSPHLTYNANNLLSHNLFSNDSLITCSLDTNTLNPEFDSLVNLC